MLDADDQVSLESLLQPHRSENTGSAGGTPAQDAAAAVAIAAQLLRRSRKLLTAEERAQQAELDRMLARIEDKATLVAMTDQAFRTRTPARVADQLTHILDLQGVPRFFSPLDRTLLRGFQSFGSYLPGVAIPLVKEKMRRETANVILPAEREMLVQHLRLRYAEGVRMNVNFLGEALLGEREARRRLKMYLDALADPDIECVSVKISTIYSQISPLAHQHTVDVVADRLELLYRAAARHRYRRPDGVETSKFVYLDMEEYRDLHLTVRCLQQALDREGLLGARAGVALQAYVPDSYGALEQLVQWAKGRVANGGQPLTVRVVKGANMEMERVEAALAGWPQAPYERKRDTDANFKRMLRLLMQPDNAAAVRIGVASHNLFDVALALLWADRQGVLQQVQFEMLEGMANHQRRALFEAAGEMLLYAPACRRDEFLYAIGYLIRRLDENTGAENFLRHTFRLEVDSPQWQQLVEGFRTSFDAIDSVSVAPRRTQDRRQDPPAVPAAAHWREFVNDPDTDWSLPHNAEWIGRVLDDWKGRCDGRASEAAVVVGDQMIGPPEAQAAGLGVRESFDPSRPGVVSCRYVEAGQSEIRRAVQTAVDDPSRWRERSPQQRHEILRRAAALMRQRRGDLIAAAVADGGKTVLEVDPEVSEAIDFTEFYPLAAAEFQDPAIGSRPRGVVAVISPWNFPVAIPCGGVVAGLAAGNTVLLKPASDTVLPAFLVCQCLWEAGVPAEALQFLPCRGADAGRFLISDDRLSCVVLTGGTATAKSMLRQRPDLELMAETGGKNATIVTALSDRDLAVKHVLHSAFSNGGQKCSATSLLLLEQEVYEDRSFRNLLVDAVQSLRVGSAWDVANRIGPLIRPPSDELARGLKELEPGESWAVLPEHVGDNPNLYRPGVKWNVQPGSFTHRTELFGPVLGVMPYRTLDEAVGIVNATGYGLTSGLESLDDREQQLWRETIRAGNLYINRPTTGAIVLRQPFGGMGASALGAGLKAGGPNYVAGLMTHRKLDETRPTGAAETADPDQAGKPDETKLSDVVAAGVQTVRQLAAAGELGEAELATFRAAATSIDRAVESEFGRCYDPLKLLGQDNLRRYLPVPHLRIRLQAEVPLVDVLVAAVAAAAVGCRAVFSYRPGECEPVAKGLQRLIDAWSGRIERLPESDEELVAAINEGAVDRLRILSSEPLAAVIQEACAEQFVSIIRRRVAAEGRVELLWYLREQAISHDYHRYGNLGDRAVTSA
ncbi:bifunctional proline dehydrogenase/L-glutamate gamma-semialdehyde dehydrogenase [Roseimaritima sediminicola]|uniref:bifunctional proline dehydrogenase/L-glutamate gamma-semialdehyde dehydrogenase n=1 Tax=Roseimaritima sediminicola TaxID=2662066 RepID=UPI001298309D|nr:bifunctional proline dehydrogenase/L-glutamate gamma-semialdehyde dehydrogenase [Roseimaritima sediminicola]